MNKSTPQQQESATSVVVGGESGEELADSANVSKVQVHDRSGNISAEELAAVMAAIEVSWPKPNTDTKPEPRMLRWRYSGRWWREGRLPSSWR